VNMNNKLTRLKAASLIILTALTFFGCGKSNNGPVLVVVPPKTVVTDPAQYGIPYASVPATKDIVMYEVNIKTFTPANFQGVSARLDSIKALGVNVIWLMPTYPIGTDSKSAGSPYCVKDYEGVNADFGSLADLRALVAQAHTLGMAVILDWEANDTSWDNAWLVGVAGDSNNPPHPDWYVQKNGVVQQLSTYADVAALNFNSAAMRLAMIKAMKYWVFTANVDGYRCDFADNAPTDFWTQAIDTLNNIKTHKLIYLAEGTNGSEITAGFQLGYAFSYYGTIKGVFGGSNAGGLFTTNTSEIASLPSPGIKLRYITNHDDASSDGSVIQLYGSKQGSLSAFVIAAYMGGVPLIYSSQEVGYPNKISFFDNVPVDYTANPDMIAAYKQILAFRAAHEAVKTGTLTPYADANVSAFEKVSGSDDILVLANTRNSAENFAVPTALQGQTWTDGIVGGTITFSTTYTLQPYQYLILKK
jgi:glycosidase